MKLAKKIIESEITQRNLAVKHNPLNVDEINDELEELNALLKIINEMDEHPIKIKIKEALENGEDNLEKIENLRDLVEWVANQSTFEMQILDGAIGDLLDDMSNDEHDACGYYQVEDVTQNIHLQTSFEF